MIPGQKSMSMNYKELFDFEGRPEHGNWGTPENEGMSVDVYENKRRKI